MATTKQNIGKIPISKGEYQEGTAYQRLNQVTMLGSTYQSKIDDNTSAPAQMGADGAVENINTDKWLCIAVGNVSAARKVVYNNETSGLEAGNVQEAIDEVGSKVSDLNTATNTKVFTTSSVANKVLRKLFLDTSNYSGSNSLEGLYIGIINKGNSKNGLQFRNSEGVTIASIWMKDENPIMDVTVQSIYVYAEFNWDNMEEGNLQKPPFIMTSEVYNKANDPRNKITNKYIADKSVTTEKLADDIFIYNTTLCKKIYGQIGDSISEGAGLTQLLQDNDKFSPITGTKKATYGYYIAKLNNMKWFNYGISGSTLGFVTVGGNDKNGFSKENGRYTKLDDSLTHISIFFGWNDGYYGPIMKKEEWLYNRYNKAIYYPTNEKLIGTVASDGTPYTTQSQYEEVNKVVGEFNGVTYTESSQYFQALYVGTSKDITNKTFWGAWNIVLPYIINKYPLAKILLIVPYGTYPLLRQCVRDAAIKYGLTIYDFSDTKNQTFFGWNDVKSEGLINNKSIARFRIDTLTADGVHPNDKGYEYMYPSINAKLMEL
nr:MAG TPA: acetyl-xylan esterase [Caudoviricetes sp.]